MAAATTRVAVSTTPWGDDKIERVTQYASGTIYYPGEMMCIDSAGAAQHGADTAGLKFDGINAESNRIQVFSTDTEGRKIKIERPWRFQMAIASAAAGDEGKPLYIVDNQTVGYAAAVTNFILVGWVEQVLSATAVSIRPVWSGGSKLYQRSLSLISANGAVAARAEQTYVVTKAGVAAMTLAAPTATTDDGLTITITSNTANAHTLTATGLLQCGTASVNVATFAAQAGAGLTLMAYQGKWNVLASVGITFS